MKRHATVLINGYMSIPLCVLARRLGEQYKESLRATFKHCRAGGNDLRAESSNVMMLILRNFHEGSLVIGEIPTTTKMEDLKKAYENMRTFDIDEAALTRSVERLFYPCE